MNPPRKWELPLTGWLGYGRPGHPFAKQPGNACGYYIHEMHAGIAEARLERDGIKPELEVYIAALCRMGVA